ncbi:DUF402 domain-containing protein [Streptomyces sp. NPDC001380]|uniref:DUF402 domain-containing protein n=1 Tax=Streptomyces sp. NPDC001380 TaxID=3364566 RepID=UPI0036758191
MHLRDIPPEERPEGGYPLRAVRWYRGNALIHQPRDGLHAVGWLFTQDLRFDGWYVGLERRIRRGDDIDVVDLEPDLVVAPDRTRQWKDEESSAARTGHPAHWSEEEAEAVRAEGESPTRAAEAGRFPLDGTWCGFTPPTAWTTPQRPPRPGRTVL